MRNKCIIVLLIVLVLLLPGCQEEVAFSVGESFYIRELYVIEGEIYYLLDGTIYRLADPSVQVIEGSPLYGEAQKLFYTLTDGVITSLDPVTGDEITVCKLDVKDIKDVGLKGVTENYIIFGTSSKSYSLNLKDLSVTELNHVFVYTTDIRTTEGDVVYIYSYNGNDNGTVSSYNLETQTEAIVYTEPFESSSLVKAMVRGDVFYSAESLGYIYCVTGLKSGEMSEPELVEESFSKGNVIALAGYDEGIYFLTNTRQNTLDLWKLPDGGEAEKLASWDELNYYFKGSCQLSVSDSLIACCVTTDENCRIFTYDLEAQQESVHYAKTDTLIQQDIVNKVSEMLPLLYDVPSGAECSIGAPLASYRLENGELSEIDYDSYPVYCNGDIVILANVPKTGDGITSGVSFAVELDEFCKDNPEASFAVIYARDGIYTITPSGEVTFIYSTFIEGLSEISELSETETEISYIDIQSAQTIPLNDSIISVTAANIAQ